MNLMPVMFKSDHNVTWEEVLENVKVNAARDLPHVGLKRICICGGGPSLADHLDDIFRHQQSGFAVAAMNGSHDYLIENGITPDYQFLLDARELNVQFVRNSTPETTYIIASQAHPAAIDELLAKGRKVMLWHVDNYRYVGELLHRMVPKADKFGGANCVGLSCMNVIYALGFKVWHFYGYDGSNRGDQHHAFPQALNDGQATHEFEFMGKKFWSSGPMAAKAQNFLTRWKKFRDLGIEMHVHGDGLLPAMFNARKEFLAEATLEEVEADKYRRMWAHPLYREASPGERLLQIFLGRCAPAPGSKIIDFGCGSGRATAALAAEGYKVLGIDFAANCLDEGVKIPFCVANLWRLPGGLSSDWGYCCDVMEHIPTDRVNDVILNIAGAVTEGAFFNISFVGDKCGIMVGEVLHNTVKPPEWWQRMLERHFAQVEFIGSDDPDRGDGIFICRKDLPHG